MIPFIYSAIVVLLSINILLGLPYAANLAENLFTTNNTNTTVLSNQVNVQASQIITPIPIQKTPQSKGVPPPVVTATSALVIDPNSEFVYFAKDPDKRVPIASTTKIMTALVAVGYFDPQTILIVNPEASVSGSAMGVKVGEKLTFRSLLFGMLLNSGNDAAFTIASNYPGGVPGFVMAMNEKAQDLGLKNTHFDNPAGFDSPTHYSSASDLAKITQVVLKNFQLSKVVSTQETTVSSADKTVVHKLKNLNQLLGKNGVVGVKTGFTPEAKENLIGLVDRSDKKVLTVVLGSDDRFGETEKLMNWVYENFEQ